jgi:L-alanine-DL-glutamate epimerase-like enolase superfamily enzyme
MKIKDIRASAHLERAGDSRESAKHEPFEFVFCEVETDEGIVGISGTGGFLVHSVVAALHHHLLPIVRDMDVRDVEAIHHRIWWKLNSRTMTGVISSALSCLDIAIWDIQGKACGRSVADLLGGAQKRIPAYVTFGFHRYDRDQLVEAARIQVRNGFSALKLVVARRPGGWKEDAQRIRAVRDAVGEDIDVIIDANYMFDPVEAKLLCRAIEDCNILWFEEPLYQNDARALADLRKSTKIPIAAGQMEGHRWRLRELVDHQAVDILQPNVCYCGGFTEARKAAHLAQCYNVPIANGGGWPLFNIHLLAGLMNGRFAEWHLAQAEAIFIDPPEPKAGWITIPDRPGLGLTINRDALKNTRVLPT